MTGTIVDRGPAVRFGCGCGVFVLLALFATACGCSPESKPERAEPRSATNASLPEHDAWGARFSLPPGFSGGPNEAGGYELTDGELALLVGRHELDAQQTLESFREGRRGALEAMGTLSDVVLSERQVGSARVVELSGRLSSEAGGVELRLLVARLGERDGISFLLMGEPKQRSRAEAAWSMLLATLVLP